MKRDSSKRWLAQQAKDVYAHRARQHGFRSRAVFKLEHIAKTHAIIRAGDRVVDLGAAPGSWSQWLSQAVTPRGQVVAVDLAEIKPIPNTHCIKADIRQDKLASQIQTLLKGEADIVVSDLAPPTTGHRATDQIRAEQIALAALHLAQNLLRQGGCFLVKSRQGGTSNLLKPLRSAFASVQSLKPPASRANSAEIYLLARNYKHKKSAPP